MEQQSRHLPDFLNVREGHLEIDNVDLQRVAEQHGTPLFVFSEKRLAHNTCALRNALEPVHPQIKLCYASKANSNMAVLATIFRSGGDIEVNSGGELFKAKQIGFRPDQIIFNGVSKTDEEIRDAIEYGILAINIDSLHELDQVIRVAQSIGRRANIAIRIVPEIITRSHIALQTGLLSSKFGLSPSLIDQAFSRALNSSDAVNLAGVHIHVGSQTPDSQPYARAFAEMWRFVVELREKIGHRFTHINIGGGLPVDYLRGAHITEEIADKERAMLSARLDAGEVLQSALAEANKEGDADLLKDITIIFEPGRRIVGDAGMLLTKVCSIKERPETGDTWLLTDAGYSVMISSVLYKWYYHLVSVTRATDAHTRPFKVAGPLCDSGDVYFDIERGNRLPNYRMLPADTAVGDVLALLNTGAYALDQASQYNGRPRPAAVMVKESGEVVLARRRETYEDLIGLDRW